MTRNDHIDIIRKACIAANPDKACPTVDSGNYCSEHATRLADVLLAIGERSDDYSVSLSGRFERWKLIPATRSDYRLTSGLKHWWSLGKDDLTEQSDETLAFLADLLKH